MPRNGSGQYNPLTNTWNPPVTGVLATGADFQAQLNDISAAITQSVSKDGQTPMTASLPMGNNSIVGIASGTETSPSISANGDTNTGVYFPAADTVAIATGGVKRVEVDANGKLFVATTSDNANARVHFAGTTQANNGINLSYSGMGSALIRIADGNALTFGLDTSAGNTERARITSDGNLLVNRTSRLNNGKIEALASTSEQAFVAQVQTNTNSLFQGFNASGSYTFYVIGSGGIYSTSTTITAISDVSQKENIRPIEYGIAEVCALNPVKFDFKEGCGSEEKDLLGFVAQDVEPVIPELVKPFGDDGLKGLKTGDMIPVLVKAIQEQQALIDAQKTAIESLTARITALEAK